MELEKKRNYKKILLFSKLTNYIHYVKFNRERIYTVNLLSIKQTLNMCLRKI